MTNDKLRRAEAQRRRYQDRKLSNCCVSCGCKLTDNHSTIMCDDCRLKASKIRLNRYIQYKSSRLCITCGEPVDPGVVRCSACRYKHNLYNRTRYQKSKHIKEK